MNKRVYIFGSNGQGFHGAGAAAFVFCGERGNVWRHNQRCLDAIRGLNKIGLHSVWGVARGYSEGTLGGSYAIQTVTHPGKKRSVSLDEIGTQVTSLLFFMRENPDFKYELLPFGSGFAGYSEEEMEDIVVPIRDLCRQLEAGV